MSLCAVEQDLQIALAGVNSPKRDFFLTASKSVPGFVMRIILQSPMGLHSNVVFWATQIIIPAMKMTFDVHFQHNGWK